MPNRDFNRQVSNVPAGRAKSPPPTGKRGDRGSAGKEKPAFPSAALPGKGQSRDRSGGVRKLPVYPKSEGL